MLLPVSVSDPLRINADRSQSPSRSQSPTHLIDSSFISPADILFHPRSISCSPFREKILKNDNASLEKDVIDWQQEGEYHPFDDPGSGQTTAVPTRHPSPVRPARPATSENNNADQHDGIKLQNLPKLVRTRRRGRSGTARKNLRLWPLIITRPSATGRSPSNSRKTWVNLGPKNQDLKTVGVDVCLRWVTDEPKLSSPLPPTPPPTPVDEHVQYFGPHSEDVIQEESPQEKLLKIVQDAIRHVEGTLESLGVDQNILYLHTQHYLSVADADVDGEMFLLEGKMADLEECVERIKVLRDDILYVHRWHLNSPTRSDDDNGGEELEVGTFAFTERDVFRRLRACFEPSTWWKEYDFGFGKEVR